VHFACLLPICRLTPPLMTKSTRAGGRHRRAAVSPHIDQILGYPIVKFETCVCQRVSRGSVMSDITSAIDRFRRDVEQIENNQATTLREMGHQIGRIVTAFQGILEEFTTSITHIQKELETACETAKVKQIQLFTSLLDVQASIEYKSQRLSGLAQEITDASQSAPPSLEQLRNDSMVIESTDFTESKRRHKLAQIATGARSAG
jgi:Sec-independent protein translocase protein TatA